jgi:hypothetical protein
VHAAAELAPDTLKKLALHVHATAPPLLKLPGRHGTHVAASATL